MRKKMMLGFTYAVKVVSPVRAKAIRSKDLFMVRWSYLPAPSKGA